MRTIILLVLGLMVLLGVVLIAAGVITFRDTETETTITLDKEELCEVTDDVVRDTREAADRAVEKTSRGLERVGQRLRDTTEDERDADEADDETVIKTADEPVPEP